MKAFGNIPSIRGLFNFFGQKKLVPKKRSLQHFRKLNCFFFFQNLNRANMNILQFWPFVPKLF